MITYCAAFGLVAQTPPAGGVDPVHIHSLCAIRKVCFEDRAYALDEFLAAVRTNWAGEKGELIRRAVLNAPYWGDNSKSSNGLVKC